jgi:hypothetical protein
VLVCKVGSCTQVLANFMGTGVGFGAFNGAVSNMGVA